MKLLSRLVLALLVLALTCLGGCTEETDGEHKDVPTQAFDANYAVTAYVTVDNEARLVSFRPAASETESVSSPLRIKDISLEQADAGTVTSSIKDLARVALSECGLRAMGARPAAPTAADPARSCLAAQFATGRAYERKVATNNGDVAAVTYTSTEPSCASTANPFLFFVHEPRTAGQVLQQEEALVCAAAKLSELADAEKPLTWPYGLYGLRYGSGPYSIDLPGSGLSLPAGAQSVPPPITFRIVQPKDKFLVRDLAMELLAYVPLLDQLPLPVTDAGVTKYYTTAELLSLPKTTSSPTTEYIAAAYNQPLASISTANADYFYPPIEVVSNAVSFPRTAQRHLEMEVANLRAAGQLMQDLITKNVYGAMAGSAQKAASLPPAERGKAFWADGADGNSAAEITRVLFGRLGTLGMEPGVVLSTNCQRDPSSVSNWLLPQNMWPRLAPASLSARGDDRPLQKGIVRRAEYMLTASRLGVDLILA